MASAPSGNLVGRYLGANRFMLRSLVGWGGSAHVYLADDLSLGRRVAVKILHEQYAHDELFRRRFRTEARAAARLDHPNIVTVFDWSEGEQGDPPYLVTQFLGGGSLRELLSGRGPLTLAQTVKVGVAAAEGLAHAHSHGFVHRDIKPANLLFGEDAVLRIADFGLARALAEVASTEAHGTFLGTAGYTSPEQARGLPVDGRADVYSLALVLIEVATGEVALRRDTIDATRIARTLEPLRAPAWMGALAGVLDDAGTVRADDRIDAATLAARLRDLDGAFGKPGILSLPGVAARDLPEIDAEPTRHRTIAPAAAAVPGDLGADHPSSPGSPRKETKRAESPPTGSRTRRVGTAVSRTQPVAAAGEVRGEVPGDVGATPRVRNRSDGNQHVRGPRSSLRRWLAAVTVVLVGGLGVGGALYLRRDRVKHVAVPPLAGLDLSAATAILTPIDLALVQAPQTFSDAVPVGQVIEQKPRAGTELNAGEAVEIVISKGPAPRPVPDLSGLSESVATDRLRELGFEVISPALRVDDEIVPAGLVKSWSPEGTQPRGSRVQLVVSNGPAPVAVPSVVGRSLKAARSAIETLGFTTIIVNRYNDAPVGQVVASNPKAGALLERAGKVTIVVSKGPELILVPDVSSKSTGDATATITSAGLKVGGTRGDPTFAVVRTEPPAGEKVRRGAGITLVTE